MHSTKLLFLSIKASWHCVNAKDSGKKWGKKDEGPQLGSVSLFCPFPFPSLSPPKSKLANFHSKKTKK